LVLAKDKVTHCLMCLDAVMLLVDIWPVRWDDTRVWSTLPVGSTGAKSAAYNCILLFEQTLLHAWISFPLSYQHHESIWREKTHWLSHWPQLPL